MKIDEVIQKWNAAKEIDDFTKIQLAEMLDSAVQYIEQQNAAQQPLAPDGFDELEVCGKCSNCGNKIHFKISTSAAGNANR